MQMNPDLKELAENLLKEASGILSRGKMPAPEKRQARELSFRLFINIRDNDEGDPIPTDNGFIRDALRELDGIIARMEAASGRKRLFYGSGRLGVIRVKQYKNTIFLRSPFWRDSSKIMERFFARLEWFVRRMEAQSGLAPRFEKRGQPAKESTRFTNGFELISKDI